MSSPPGDVNTLNPMFGQFADVGRLAELTMAWLIRWDEQNRPIPELATAVPTKSNGGVSKDGLKIAYHLRKGVKWSDGAPFDADDVVFSFNAMLSPANRVLSRTGWDLIKRIDEPDKYTVILHLSKPYSPYVETFFSSAGNNPSLLPRHLLARYHDINNASYNSLPIGIGPFKFTRWDRLQRVTMVANPLYWRGKPKLDEIDYDIIPDRDTMFSRIEAKEIDLWYIAPANYLSRLQRLKPYAIMRRPSYIYARLAFNMEHADMSDPTVRAALRLAVDRAALLEKVGHGAGILQEVTTPPTAPYAVNDVPLIPFDLAKANALLDKDGWMRGADGVRTKNGRRLSLLLASQTGSPDVAEQIELIRSWWRQIGVDLDVRLYTPNQLYAPPSSGGIVYGNSWDVITVAWVSDAIGDPYFFVCDRFAPAGPNYMRWCDARVRAAMSSLYAHYDQVQRNADRAAIDHAFVKDEPSIVLYAREDIFAYNKDLKNFHPNAITPFDNMMQVDI